MTKSPKPNDPTRLQVKSFGTPKADKYGESITIPVHVRYDTWCCTNAHEYAHAFKCISDLFENAEEFREKATHISAQLEYIAEKLSFTSPATPEEQGHLAKQLTQIAHRLSAVYKENEDEL